MLKSSTTSVTPQIVNSQIGITLSRRRQWRHLQKLWEKCTYFSTVRTPIEILIVNGDEKTKVSRSSFIFKYKGFTTDYILLKCLNHINVLMNQIIYYSIEFNVNYNSSSLPSPRTCYRMERRLLYFVLFA